MRTFYKTTSFCFYHCGTGRVPTTTTSKMSILYYCYSLDSTVNSSLCFNIPLRNSHSHYSGQQVYLLSISSVPSAVWTQSEDSSLYFIDSATREQYKSTYNLILIGVIHGASQVAQC